MAAEDSRSGDGRFAPSVPPQAAPYRLKGSSGLDWGMQSRLARVFRPADGRTVMLAIDHGYFQGPASGLERVDLSIVPLLRHADALMTTQGMVGSTIPPASGTPIRNESVKPGAAFEQFLGR
jgi:putative autoinducer-2 (AI-2) aldolase